MTSTGTTTKIQQAVAERNPALAYVHVLGITRKAAEIFAIVVDEFDTEDEAIAEAIEVAAEEYAGYLTTLI
jgi:hypothetical protein